MIRKYPFPEELEPNREYSVSVREAGSSKALNLVCYNAPVCRTCLGQERWRSGPESERRNNMAFVSFESDFSSPVEVTVTNNISLSESVQIRPSSSKINYIKDNNTVKFIIEKPTKLSIEFDNDMYHNLFLYAEAPETDIPDKNDDNVIYFDAGIHEQEIIELKDNQTLYLAPGSYVYGRIEVTEARNIKICGRGVLSGAKMPHEPDAFRPNLVKLSNTDGIVIKDVILLDGPGWTSAYFHCKNVYIDNMKHITNYYNGDGLDICSCQNFLAENMFLRDFDDCISIKGFGTDNRNITIRDSVFWNDCAHSMLIGPESPVDKYSVFSDILFENIVVLNSQEHNPDYIGIMAMMCTNNATFKNITWRNIEIEHMEYGTLISARYQTCYGSCIGKSIENIHFDNIKFNGTIMLKSPVLGFDEEHKISDFVIKDLYINGRKQTDAMHYFETNEFTDMRFE